MCDITNLITKHEELDKYVGLREEIRKKLKTLKLEDVITILVFDHGDLSERLESTKFIVKNCKVISGVNSARFVGGKCDKEWNCYCAEHDRIVMEETGRMVLSFYTLALFGLMLTLTNRSKRDTTIVEGLSNNPAMLDAFISFSECAKKEVQRVFGEHNSIREMIKNEVDKMEDIILCFLSFVGDDYSYEKFWVRHEKLKRLGKFDSIREMIKSDIDKMDDRILCSLFECVELVYVIERISSYKKLKVSDIREILTS